MGRSSLAQETPFLQHKTCHAFFRTWLLWQLMCCILLAAAQHCRNAWDWENMKAVLLNQSQSSPIPKSWGTASKRHLQSNTSAALVSCQPDKKLVETVVVPGPVWPVLTINLPNHFLNTFLFWHLEHPMPISSTIPCHTVWTSTALHLCQFRRCTLPSIPQYCSSYSSLCQSQLWPHLPPLVPFPGRTV